MFHFQYSKSSDTFRGKAFPLFLVICILVGGASLDGFGVPQSGNSDSADKVLSGVVSSEAEGEMEGVLVTAMEVGGTVAVTVVTDHQGRYVFPPGRQSLGRTFAAKIGGEIRSEDRDV